MSVITRIENKLWNLVWITLRPPPRHHEIRCVVKDAPVDPIVITVITWTSTKPSDFAPFVSTGVEESAGFNEAAT